MLRAARAHVGLSQREMAARAGVSPTSLAAAEAERSAPSLRLLTAVLAAAGLEIGLAALSQPLSRPLDDHLRAWLSLSTSERLYLSVGGTLTPRLDRRCFAWQQLALVARHHLVSLPADAALGVWLPDRKGPHPLPVHVERLRWPTQPCPVDVADLEALVADAVPLPAGRPVAVGVSLRHEVQVPSPLMMALSTPDAGLASELRQVSALLHEPGALDGAARRRPPHRQSDGYREHQLIMTTRGFGDRPRAVPNLLDQRTWRLGGDVSLRQWLGRRGYPESPLPLRRRLPRGGEVGCGGATPAA